MIVAIPASKLGVLEAQFKALGTYKLKRERKAELIRLTRVLKDLRLIARGMDISALAFGLDGAGEACAFISDEVNLHHQGEVVPS